MTNPTTADTAETTQKRITTVGSAQPMAWKW